jgi:hypothetical protein
MALIGHEKQNKKLKKRYGPHRTLKNKNAMALIGHERKKKKMKKTL